MDTNMTRSAAIVTAMKRAAAVGAVLGFASIGIIAAPKPANAWWHRGYGYGWCCRVYAPHVFFVPRVYAPAPVYYAPRPIYYAPRPVYVPGW
jgi:hypothetical protein